MLKNKNYISFFHYWLIILTILIALIIIVGGLTRLTDSGLSITEWELFKGILPPNSPAMWEIYFAAYKKIPQYILLNSSMTLQEFKIIFLWEYGHRLLARFIGFFFLIPFLFFLVMNLLEKKLFINLLCIFFLILIQGSIGWYMVKSGLIENISVSHYRLSTHLFIAFLILSSLVWILLNSLNKTKKIFFELNFNHIYLKILLFLLFTQIILGAFVSGLDAGKIYQTWPLMNNGYLPDDKQLILYKFFIFYFLVVFTQIILGVLVLVSGVNLYIASMHQISSIFLMVSALNLYYRTIAT